MNCGEFEDRLEALLDGELDGRERERCARHLEACPGCRELADPLGLAEAPPEGLLDAVLASTSGSPCGRAEDLLCGWLDGELDGADRELMAAHLETCSGCHALAAAMTRLAAELPRLAEMRPDPDFVDAVLRAPLPVRVRLRRWWAVAWPSWVRRPRFASEAAFVGTLALVLVFATPGSPLAAVPNQALGLARTDPRPRIEARLEAPVAAIEESFTTHVGQPLGARYARGAAKVGAWSEAAADRGRALVADARSWIGTSRDRLASLLESADEKASETQDDAPNPTQETP